MDKINRELQRNIDDPQSALKYIRNRARSSGWSDKQALELAYHLIDMVNSRSQWGPLYFLGRNLSGYLYPGDEALASPHGVYIKVPSLENLNG